ncbi:divergent polysaccharide deacetylase family protein [Roseobacter insulae]|nr:divergent polysaccharide deacetylase family protein [Roseobacter insulae]
MARGFLRGALWGSAASLCVAGIVSVMADGPVAPVVTAAAPAKDAAPRPAVTNAQQSQGDRAPVTGQQAPKAPAPQPDTLLAVRDSDTAPAALPETGGASALSGPSAEDAQGGIDTSKVGTPVVSNPQTPGLAAPVTEPSLSVSTDPAQPPAPQVSDDIALSEDPEQPGQPSVEADTVALASPSTDQAPPPVDVETSISVEPDQPPLPEVPAEAQAFDTSEPSQVTDDAPQETGTPSASPDATADTVSPEVEIVQDGGVISDAPLEAGQDEEIVTETAPDPAPQVIASDDGAGPEGEVLESIGTPVGTFGNLAPEVKTNRLPTLGEEPEAAPEPLPLEDIEEVAPDPGAENRPVVRFAAPHENPDGKPVMAIVLMDDGVDLSADTIGLPALRSFPYPVSFAVDTSLPDAKDRMAAYRAEGFEVLAMVDLPQGARARDAEISMSVALEAIPEAVGVLEGVGEGVQGTRDAARQVTEILAASGHGFVTQNKGLNTVQKLAAKAGVPSAVVFRDFDSSQQTPTVIRRFLDQAAFRADNEGGVIMLGRLREDTISALLLWALQDRAKRVALVPVSAALTTQ